VVDTAVAQASWSADKLDGTGQSGITIDTTKSQILAIDLEWLGVGVVRAGFVIDGAIIPAHVFRHANIGSGVYMTTANLPVRYEVTNTGGVTYKRVGYFDGDNGVFLEHRSASATASMSAICASVISEGGIEDSRAIPFAVSNGITTISVTTRRPFLSMRPKATFNSIVNRGQIIFDSGQAFTTGNNSTYVEIVYGGTLTNASFASVDASSIAEFDVAATAISGGITIDAFFLPSSAQTRATVTEKILARLPISLDIDGANPTVISMVATSFTTAAPLSGVLNWMEIR